MFLSRLISHPLAEERSPLVSQWSRLWPWCLLDGELNGDFGGFFCKLETVALSFCNCLFHSHQSNYLFIEIHPESLKQLPPESTLNGSPLRSQVRSGACQCNQQHPIDEVICSHFRRPTAVCQPRDRRHKVATGKETTAEQLPLLVVCCSILLVQLEWKGNSSL